MHGPATQRRPVKKPGIRERAQELASDGVAIWFDATTHALQMGGVGDFRYHDKFDLWGGPRGDLSTHAIGTTTFA